MRKGKRKRMKREEEGEEEDGEDEGYLVQQADLSDQICREGAAVPASSMPLPGAKARHRVLCA